MLATMAARDLTRPASHAVAPGPPRPLGVANILPRHLLAGSIESLPGLLKLEDDDLRAQLPEPPRSPTRLRRSGPPRTPAEKSAEDYLPKYLITGSLEKMHETVQDATEVPLACGDDDNDNEAEAAKGAAAATPVPSVSTDTLHMSASVPTLVTASSSTDSFPLTSPSDSPMARSPVLGTYAIPGRERSQSHTDLPTKGRVAKKSPRPAAVLLAGAGAQERSRSTPSMFAAPGAADAQAVPVSQRQKRRPSKGSSMLHLLFHIGGGSSGDSEAADPATADAVAGAPGLPPDTASPLTPASPNLSFKRSALGAFIGRLASGGGVGGSRHPSPSGSMSQLDTIAEAPDEEEEAAPASR